MQDRLVESVFIPRVIGICQRINSKMAMSASHEKRPDLPVSQHGTMKGAIRVVGLRAPPSSFMPSKPISRRHARKRSEGRSH